MRAAWLASLCGQALPAMDVDVSGMRKAELMKFASSLGVATRRQGQDGKKCVAADG